MGAPRLIRSAFVLCPFCFVLCCAGCRSNNDLVEAELRTKEMQLRSVQEERDHLVAFNDALQREVKALRGVVVTPTPEEASQTCPLRTIVLGRQTGGLDEDGCPGDEALQVLVEPRDAEGHTLKVPGTLLIQALEITPEGLKKPLSAWQFGGDALRRAWRSGLLTTGYYFVLPWKNWPATDKVRVVAQFVLADGRAFEAERDVTVRVAPAGYRKPGPPAEGPPAEPLSPLPAPRPLDPPPLPLPGETARHTTTSGAPPDGAQPAAHWQKARPAPLLDAVQILPPVPLPDRPEWSR
jgi:hypothetical protein